MKMKIAPSNWAKLLLDWRGVVNCIVGVQLQWHGKFWDDRLCFVQFLFVRRQAKLSRSIDSWPNLTVISIYWNSCNRNVKQWNDVNKQYIHWQQCQSMYMCVCVSVCALWQVTDQAQFIAIMQCYMAHNGSENARESTVLTIWGVTVRFLSDSETVASVTEAKREREKNRERELVLILHG